MTSAVESNAQKPNSAPKKALRKPITWMIAALVAAIATLLIVFPVGMYGSPRGLNWGITVSTRGAGCHDLGLELEGAPGFFRDNC